MSANISKEKQVAMALIKMYEELTKSDFGTSEIKLQKMMYYIQKHSLAFTGKPMFKELFKGWIHGPVLTSLRGFLEVKEIDDNVLSELTDEEKYIIENVIREYGYIEPWKLRDMSHNENAWIKSREGLKGNENGNKKISIKDMLEDAKKIRLYDHIFDMYVDEFEEVED